MKRWVISSVKRGNLVRNGEAVERLVVAYTTHRGVCRRWRAGRFRVSFCGLDQVLSDYDPDALVAERGVMIIWFVGWVLDEERTRPRQPILREKFEVVEKVAERMVGHCACYL